ncbi:CAF1-domain-containing protein [Xylaria cf. heliscus]|nr:CAF1-domain-containing protein [Xylaria cf. heliscus]
MEMNSTTFWAMLPELVGALADSRWVAIDVEMTGISTGGHFIPPGSTPQAAYQSVKEAAESYQILQIGFTFCKYNNISSEYEIKTIECPISPLFPSETGSKALTQALNRQFTTSVSSYAFLRDHNFSFSKMLDSGVPYLSREEELDIKRRDIQMLSNDPVDVSKLRGQSMRFYWLYKNRIQHAVEYTRDRERICVPVPSPSGQGLNKIETKLIYQLLQDNFPFLVITEAATDGQLNVVWANSARIARRQRKNTEALNRFIGKSTHINSIRHVFDALAGEEFGSKIKQSWIPGGTQNCHIDLNGNNRPGFGHVTDMSQVDAIFKAKSPIIVGHNLFHDLAFIYRTFFGRLPETLDEFLAAIHKLFPRIIDSKYMFVRGQAHQGQAPMNRSLSELYSMYAGRQFPFIRSTDNFVRESKGSHHAGHDSALTMMLFLKQAVYLKSFWSQSHGIPEMVYRPRNPAETSRPRRECLLDEQGEWEKASRGGLNRYTPLQPNQAAPPARDLLPLLGRLLQDSAPWRSENYSMREMTIIPPWSDAFWREFGNKTRIGNAGTVEFK